MVHDYHVPFDRWEGSLGSAEIDIKNHKSQYQSIPAPDACHDSNCIPTSFFPTPPYSDRDDENSNPAPESSGSFYEGSEPRQNGSLISSEGYFSCEDIDNRLRLLDYNTSPKVQATSLAFVNKKGKTVMKAPYDPVLLNPTILSNLLRAQGWYRPQNYYFNASPHPDLEINSQNQINQGGLRQSEITADMRKVLATWMFEVCQECKCSKDVFLFAINLMDRFLCRVDIRKTHFQLVGSVALFIASKFKEACPLSASIICVYTDNLFTVRELLEWELFFSSILNWDFGYIIPLSFSDLIYHTLSRGPINGESLEVMKDNTSELLALCAIDDSFMMERPSDLMAACTYVAYQFFERDDPKYEVTLSHLFLHLYSLIQMNQKTFAALVYKVNGAFEEYLKKVEQRKRGR